MNAFDLYGALILVAVVGSGAIAATLRLILDEATRGH